jgi:hypothetical protein
VADNITEDQLRSLEDEFFKATAEEGAENGNH